MTKNKNRTEYISKAARHIKNELLLRFLPKHGGATNDFMGEVEEKIEEAVEQERKRILDAVGELEPDLYNAELAGYNKALDDIKKVITEGDE